MVTKGNNREVHKIKATNNLSSYKINLLFQAILFLIIIVAIVMPLLHHFYIYPSFTKEVLKNTQNDAARTCSFLKRILFKRGPENTIILTDGIRKELHLVIKDFSLMKIKIFSDLGEVIFSTSQKDIGKINRRSYFHEIVAKGKPFTKVVKKDTPTMENQVTTSDVVETYIPIMRQGQFVGAFEIYYDITERKKALDKLVSTIRYLLFSLSFLLILTISFILIRVKLIFIEHRQMEEKLEFFANTDTLTQLCNRRRFLEYLEKEISRFRRYSNPAIILIFDIDHFKQVNDTYGHQVGDKVLRLVAQTCKDNLRVNDLIGRYGGEEFIVLLPETNKKQALLVAEKIRHAIENLQIPQQKEYLSVTISIGIAPFQDGKPISEDILIRNADKALYEAKNSGRNRAIYYEE